MKKLLIISLLAFTVSACVTQEKYNEAMSTAGRYYDEARSCQEELASTKHQNKELEAELSKCKALKEKAEADTAKLSRELKRVQEDCAAMQTQNRELFEKLQASKSPEEAQALLAEIQGLQTELIKREDALFQAERDLADKQKELEVQNLKIMELNRVLAEKDATMQALKERIKTALTAYEGNGLQISTRGGRIYVSMEEKLLFPSGSWNVDQRGIAAIEQLSNVLAQHKDIDIMVEGHTDDVPYKNGVLADNWDLSVKRATAIVRMLLKNPDVQPSRVIAAGRSEYCPIDSENTPEARRKNRRIEIILSPNMDELMKALE